jgi:hypothetical protein
MDLDGKDRLLVILDMLRSVETLTFAGQRHTIVRITGLLEEEIVRRAREATGPALEAIAALLPRLRGEAERLSPDIQTFVHDAELLIDAVGPA